MRRRELLSAIAGTALLAPRMVEAQQAARPRRIGYLTPATGSPRDLLGVFETRAFVEGLRQLGWFDGRNITIDHRFSGNGGERIQASVAEIVAANPDVIVSVGAPQLTALLAKTQTIPIVFTMVGDPVASGFIASLAHPGGNATGLGVNEAPLAGKWVELLKELSPPITRGMVLIQAESRPQQLLADAAAAAAAALALPLVVASVAEPADYDRQIAIFAREPGGGLVALPNPIIFTDPSRVLELAAQYRLPAVYGDPSFARAGGLIGYGADSVGLFREAAAYVDKILRGARPGDLPVQQPTRFGLAVNLKTAKALGLIVPQAILARADEVIE